MSRFVLLGKLLVGLGLLAFLFSRIDLQGLLQRLSSLDAGYLLLLLTLPHFGIWLSSVKWHALLRSLGVRVRLRRLFALYMIGTFFNNFLPTMVGGDVIKAYQLSRETRDAASVIAATFMERFVGLAALVSLLPLIYLQEDILSAYPMLGLVVAVAILSFLVASSLVFWTRIRIPGSDSEVPIVRRLSRLAKKTRAHVISFRRHRSVLSSSFAISVLFYAVAAATAWAAIRCTGLSVGYLYVGSFLPIVLLAGLAPVTVNGLGVTESGYVLFLGLVGLSTVDAVTIALLLRARILVTSVFGGLVFVIYRGALPEMGAAGGSMAVMPTEPELPTGSQPPSR